MIEAESTRLRGTVLALLVALSYATNSTFAGLAYGGGSNSVSVFAVRSTAAFVALLIGLRLMNREWTVPPEQRVLAIALGLVLAGASWALLGAMEMMPVALCVITLYTYPIIVAAIGWVSGREAFSVRYALALVCAFVGLILALDLSGEVPSLPGVVLAAGAAFGVALLLVVNERQHAARGSPQFTLHMLGTCTIVSLAASAFSGDFALPHTVPGWIGFIGTPVCYSFSVIFMFVAVSMIGSVRTSLLMNLEPVSAVILGYLLLAQRLAPSQLFGIALVVSAIVAIEGVNVRLRRAAARGQPASR